VDADRLARRHLRQLLEDEPDLDLVAECDAGGPAIEGIALARPDLVFLDVTLPDFDGFALGARLRSHVPGGLVYVSDRPQGALQAFDVHALGYLLKPVGRERLRAPTRGPSCCRIGAASPRSGSWPCSTSTTPNGNGARGS
jgi:two-component system LytT family response regulator